jgi:hypothetical protein
MVMMTVLITLSTCFYCEASLPAEEEESVQSSIGSITSGQYSVFSTQNKSKPYVVIHSAWGWGFFAEFQHTIGALHYYDEGILAGVSLEYDTTGVYYDSVVGPNWWEYYFEPLHLGSRQNSLPVHCFAHIFIDDVVYLFNWIPGIHDNRKNVHRLLSKYVKVKPHIEEKVNQIVENSFGYSTIIGVHYRGTDKWTEAPRAPYENVAAYVDDTIAELEEIGHSDIKIFVATDEQNFLDYMRERYPSIVICYEESERSVDGVCVHMSGTGGTPYKKGEDALIDCLLLSKTDILLKTASNLSLCASYFNPEIPVVNMTICSNVHITKD